jgi:hypothetical protein
MYTITFNGEPTSFVYNASNAFVALQRFRATHRYVVNSNVVLGVIKGTQ